MGIKFAKYQFCQPGFGAVAKLGVRKNSLRAVMLFMRQRFDSSQLHQSILGQSMRPTLFMIFFDPFDSLPGCNAIQNRLESLQYQ